MKAAAEIALRALALALGLLAARGSAADDGCVASPVAQPSGRLASASAAELLRIGTVDDRDGVSIVELEGNYDRLLPDGSLNSAPRLELARSFYGSHGDDYDFLLVASGFQFDTGSARAVAWRAKNDVEGIGLPIVDLSAEFGSAGRLRNYVDLGALAGYALDPLDPKFESLLIAATHEILHSWGAELRFRQADGTLSAALTSGEGHWSYLFDSQASVLYGNDWRDDQNGSFTSIATEKVWGPLDLYLAGMIGANEVPPLLLIENPAIDPLRRGAPGATVVGEPSYISIDEIVAAEGPRLPSATEAQHEFRAGLLFLVRPGIEPSEQELLALETFRRALIRTMRLEVSQRLNRQMKTTSS